MPQPNARLTLRLSPVSSNRDPQHYMSLVVEDAASGQTVAQFELLGEHLMDLLSNRQVGSVDGVRAYLIPELDRPTLGKLRTTTVRTFPTYEHEEAAVQTWATQYAGVVGAHSFHVKRNNAAKYVVVFTHYIDVDTEQELERETRIRQGLMDTAGPPASK